MNTHVYINNAGQCIINKSPKYTSDKLFLGYIFNQGNANPDP